MDPYPYSNIRRRRKMNVDDGDFLGARKLGRRFLVDSNGTHTVEVESLRGKVLCILFDTQQAGFYDGQGRDIIDFYTTLKNPEHPAYNSFEMVYVLKPSKSKRPTNPLLQELGSWLSIPLEDEGWRSLLTHLYSHRDVDLDAIFIDTSTDSVKILIKEGMATIRAYGHHSYPFTPDRFVELDAQYEQLRKETSLKVILGSGSGFNDYLLDRHFNKVPLSHLEAIDTVAIYAYTRHHLHSSRFTKQLMHLHDQLATQGISFQVVFINLHYDGGYEDENSFNYALSQMPWLALPFRHARYWSLRYMLFDEVYSINSWKWEDHPTLFIKTKGRALLDPYGYQVIQMFGGIEAYPFTRRAALRVVTNHLKHLTFKFFLHQADKLGLDFSSLIINKNKHGLKQRVSLSKIIKRRKCIILVFLNSVWDHTEELNRLMGPYYKQQEQEGEGEESSPFDVIVASMDESLHKDISSMPCLRLRKQRNITTRRLRKLFLSTIKLDFTCDSAHFIAFGPKGNFLKLGTLESFENFVFPYNDESNFNKDLAQSMTYCNGWFPDYDTTMNGGCVDWLDDC